MIRYALKCENDHQFESWFQSATAFDTLAAANHLSCIICGSEQVVKAVMAPKIQKSDAPQATEVVEAQKDEAPAAVASTPPPEVEQALKAIRKKVESEADYVGDNFAQQARGMHLGDQPQRAIYGEANAEQAKSLIEDGIPVLPLPFRPKRKLS